MDTYQAVRSLSFSVICRALGLDVATYKLHKQGTEYQGRCPVHQAVKNNSSFSYNVAGQWHCFSCNAKGKGAIDLLKAARSLNFTQAVEFLTPYATNGHAKEKTAQRADSSATQRVDGVATANIQTGAVDGTEDSQALLTPFKGSYDKFAVPCPWLEQRIPNADIRTRYGVFCYNNPARRSAWSGRVMIPVKDEHGLLFGYLGRNIDHGRNSDTTEEVPKYLFPKNLPKSKFLFGAFELRQHLADTGFPPSSRFAHVFLVESPFSVLKFASMGIPALSCFGWSVSSEQIEIVAGLSKGCIFLPDRNKHDAASEYVAKLASRVWCRFPPLPTGCDDPEQLELSAIQALAR